MGEGETSTAILRFLQSQESKLKDKLSPPDTEEDESKSEPTWLDEQDRLAEYESSQSERANDMTVKAIQKLRAANILRSYAEGIHAELEKLKSEPGDHSGEELKLTTQLEANLARVALLHKQSELLRHEADVARIKLNNVHSSADHSSLLFQDCNMLKIGPLFYSARSDNIDHKDRVPLMAKLNGNSLVIYHDRKPQITYYLVDISLPTRPAENAPSCFTFVYRGAPQALCAGSEVSCHSWMNALTEAWFCRNAGLKGVMVRPKDGKNVKVRSGAGKDKSKKGADTLAKYAVKDNPDKGLINMEVYVDDKNKTHMTVNGKEQRVTGTADIINFQEVLKDLENKKG
ncbi:uncharacterized protein BXIN_2460 [Babesia sp. Xinjiang]|uniref:uncharacterized protein n=1 Tax=Babesia sp. Xinjiang TaxID=462227 RepID=UPI000A23BA4E|nr:uncharacterized protein BXIN_2460 [Babesia sp. Xinjiang]ORM41494.1 hypothetical protein BXIN_2460 [Babesia sp. Xinjiang]